LGRVIAIANRKGGVGKTTSAINLGAGLATQGVTTLIIDCDPQSNTTGGLGFPKDPHRRSLYHALLLDTPLADLIVPCGMDRLSLIPSEKDLIGATIELLDRPNREHVLRRKLEPIRDRFQFLILDCPPAMDILTLNALVAADTVIVPVQCEYMALEGVSELRDNLRRLKHSLNPKLEIEGILLTMYDERTSLAKQVRDDLRQFFGDKVFATIIPRNVRLAEAPSFGQPIFLYDPHCRGAESYLELAKEVIRGTGLGATGRGQGLGVRG